MILPVYIYGQPVLRKEAEDITPDYPNLKELIENMFETMDRADGCGLAAPQIGLPIRVVVIDLDIMSDDYPEYKGYRKAFINPHIIEFGCDFTFFGRKQMNRLLADNAVNFAFFRQYFNFTCRNIQFINTAVWSEIEQTVIRNINDLKTDFIIMTGKHDTERSISI